MRGTKLVSVFTALATSAVLGVGFAPPSSAAGSADHASVTQAVTAPSPFQNIPVTGSLPDGTGTVAGRLDITRFEVKKDGQVRTLYAVGTFTGQITNAAGAVLATGGQQIALPVDVARSGADSAPSGLRATSSLAAAQLAACDILNLVLGPLDLNLLGLEVHLNQVVLDIVAQPGAGNLLCAVAPGCWTVPHRSAASSTESPHCSTGCWRSWGRRADTAGVDAAVIHTVAIASSCAAPTGRTVVAPMNQLSGRRRRGRRPCLSRFHEPLGIV